VGNAIATTVTDVDSMRIVAVLAVVIAALQKNNEPASRPIDTREVDNLAD